ncbi:pesticidal protein Cry7Aa [Patescibacteria group bacterium]|nr:pesticidal protein Cry7Aa [Patescibacteria group bacterium]
MWRKLNKDWKREKDSVGLKKTWQKLNKDWKREKDSVGLKKLGVILKSTDRFFEKKAVLNPACCQEEEFVHIFYRAIDDNNISTIGYAKLKGPTEVVERKEIPLIPRTYDYERKGVEDPRITKFGKIFYLTYVAHDGKNALTAYATSRDLKTWRKRGIISPLITYRAATSLFKKEGLKDRYLMFETFYEELSGKDVLLWFKDVLLFPKKINGKFAMLIRILPDIQIVFFESFKELKERGFWKNYLKKLYKNVVLENKYWFESRNIGGGAPPIYTKDGWLVIFHTVEELNKARIYHASAALLDKKNPLKVIGRLSMPLFSPEKEWEKTGFVNNVVFPTGTAVFGKDLYIYYGVSDDKIAVAKVNLNKLLNKLKNAPQK